MLLGTNLTPSSVIWRQGEKGKGDGDKSRNIPCLKSINLKNVHYYSGWYVSGSFPFWFPSLPYTESLFKWLAVQNWSTAYMALSRGILIMFGFIWKSQNLK